MHVAAEGPLKNIIIILIVAVVALAAITYSEPFGTEYEVKTAAKVACNQLVQDHIYKTPEKRSWEQPFLQRTRAAGVQLKKEQYSFVATLTKQMNTCHAQIAWRSVTPVAFIGDILGLPPLVIVHRINMKHEVKANW
jgi:hypothetical protein